MPLNRIIYGLLIIVLFFFYVYCNAYVPLYVIYLVLLLTLMSGVAAFIASRKLEVTASSENSYLDINNREIGLCSIISNQSIMPAPLVVFDVFFLDKMELTEIKNRIVTSEAIIDEHALWFSVKAPYASCIEAGVKNVKVCDAFGIFSFRVKKERQSITMLVPPSSAAPERDIKIIPQNVLDSDIYSNVQKGDDRSQVFEVREYRDGDDMRRIHWSLSSKLDELIVKEYSKPIDERCTILLETSLYSGDVIEIKERGDMLLSEFVSISKRLLDRVQRFSVLFYSQQRSGLLVFEAEKLEDISVVMKSFLSEQPPITPMCSLDAYLSDYPNSSTVYYIYDSSVSGEMSIPGEFGFIYPIDIADRISEQVI